MNLRYTFGKEYDEAIEIEELEKYEKKNAFKAVWRKLNDIENLARIVYEYNDEYED